jgi:hypothetical protein
MYLQSTYIFNTILTEIQGMGIDRLVMFLTGTW